MKHLVTGGAGFLGSLIAEKLCAEGQSVRVLDLWEDPKRPREIEFVRGDVRDEACMAEAMRGMEVVHHNAALVPLTKSGARKFFSVNAEGSRRVAQQAVKSGVKYFVYMSSSAVFGLPDACPITEQTVPQPMEIYGRSKLAGENAVTEICLQAGLPLLLIRPRTILGKGRLGIFEILFSRIRSHKTVYIIGDGSQRFQFIHAEDLINAYMLALKKGKAGIYNIGTDRFGTLREALENVIAYAESKSKVKGLPAPFTIGILEILDKLRLSPLAPWHYKTYHKDFFFDVSPLLKMGWKPKYSNDEMFRESYDGFIQKESLSAGSPHRRPVKEGILNFFR